MVSVAKRVMGMGDGGLSSNLDVEAGPTSPLTLPSGVERAKDVIFAVRKGNRYVPIGEFQAKEGETYTVVKVVERDGELVPRGQPETSASFLQSVAERIGNTRIW